MKSAKFLSSAIIASLLLDLPASASYYVGSSSFVHPKIASGQVTIHSACIMPVKGQVTEIAVKHRGVLPEASANWSAALQRVVEAHLKAANVATDLAVGSEPEVQQIQQSYDAIYPKLEKKPKDIEKDTFTLGSDVAKLSCASKSDVLVFVEAETNVFSVGIATMSLFAPTPGNNDERLGLSFVDAKSGEVVAYLKILNARPSLFDPEKTFGGALDKELKKMNLTATIPAHP